MAVTRETAIDLAAKIEGWMSREELGWLYDRASELPPGAVWVEVGTWKGRSALATALGLPTGGRMLCVDHLLGNPECDLYRRPELSYKLRESLKNVADLVWKLRPDVSFHFQEADSKLAARMSMEPCDVVFIDASHDHENVKRDVNEWLPKLKPGGLMCGHDWGSSFPGVEKAVREVLGNPQLAVGNIWQWRKPQQNAQSV